MERRAVFAWVLRTVGFAGAALFALVFYLTYSTPDWVERAAAGFIEAELRQTLDDAIDAIQPGKGDGALARAAGALLKGNEARLETLKDQLKNRVHETMADALARIRDLDCECRNHYAEAFRRGFEVDMALLQAANDRLVAFIQSGYMETVAALKTDIRIFSASNGIIFLLLLLASFLKPAAIEHLFLPGMLLTVSTTVCSFFYVFEQNWLLTILYNNYLGWGYLAYLMVLFALLCDIAFNRARVTTEIINALLEAVGSVASLSPC